MTQQRIEQLSSIPMVGLVVCYHRFTFIRSQKRRDMKIILLKIY